MVILVIVLVAVLFNSFSNSPLRHFPIEAGASIVSDNYTDGTGGESNETLVIDDPGSLTAVETYYQSALGTNGWKVQPTNPGQAVSGDGWLFGLTGSTAQFGITFVAKGGITEVTVQYAAGPSAPPITIPVNPTLTAAMLTPTEVTAALPSLSTPVTNYLDAQVNGQYGTDQREYFGPDGTDQVDIDLFAYVNPQAAAHDYPNLVSAACGPGDGKPAHPKIGTATQTDELQCTTGVFWITFQQGSLTCALSTGSAGILEALAKAESAKISQVAGS